jgi:hypothetical protein
MNVSFVAACAMVWILSQELVHRGTIYSSRYKYSGTREAQDKLLLACRRFAKPDQCLFPIFARGTANFAAPDDS